MAELTKRGIRLTGRPACKTRETDQESVLRVNCTAKTRTGRPVAVRGREQYVVTVGGRVVLRRDCLGLGCG